MQEAAHLGDPGGGRLYDVERGDDLDRVEQDGLDGLLPGERVHNDHLDASSEFVATCVHPFVQHLGRTDTAPCPGSGRVCRQHAV